MIDPAEFTPDGKMVVIGAAGMDVIAHLDGNLQTGTSNSASIRSSFGGVARNVAENLSRLGQPVQLITAVGADRNGDDILAHASEQAIDVSAVLRSHKFPTGYYMGVLDGKSTLIHGVDDMRVMSALTPSYLGRHKRQIEDASMVFIDCNLPDDSIEFVMSTCTRRNIPVCADPTTSILAIRLLPYLPHLHLVAPNSKETGILIGQPFDASDRDAALLAARHLVSLGVKIALVTMAEFGVCYATSEPKGHISSIRTKIVDPTGAGDALIAAVIFGLLNDIEIDEAIRLGVSAASLTLRTPGTVCQEMTLEKLYDQLHI